MLTKSQRDWRDNRESRQATNTRQRLKRMGHTTESYQELVQAQGNRCAICHTDKPGGRGDWAIDHDHRCCDTKGVANPKVCGQCNRGLLCTHCNMALGQFKDDIDILANALAYLLEFEAQKADRMSA